MTANSVTISLPTNALVVISCRSFGLNLQQTTVSLSTSISDTAPQNFVFTGGGDNVPMLLPDQTDQIDLAPDPTLNSRICTLSFQYSTGGSWTPAVNVQNPVPTVTPEFSNRPKSKQWVITSGDGLDGDFDDSAVLIVADEFVWNMDDEAAGKDYRTHGVAGAMV